MKLSFLIVIVVLFSSSLFAEDWEVLPLKISDILKEGYELKEVTVDPSSREGLHRILYHFISYKKKRIIVCSVDIMDSGPPNDTTRFSCYASPQ